MLMQVDWSSRPAEHWIIISLPLKRKAMGQGFTIPGQVAMVMLLVGDM
jgi:hypothetical protein